MNILIERNMNQMLRSDGNGNYIFIHYGDIVGTRILPSKWGKNVYTSDRRRVGVSYYYTQLNQRESMVSGKPYVVLVPKDSVYFYNSDPDGFYEIAYKKFKQDHPNQVFDPPSQLDYMHPLIAAAGYDMVVAKWENGLRGETTKPLKYDKLLTAMLQKYNTLDVDDKVKTQYLKTKILNAIAAAANSASGQANGITDKFYASKKIDLDALLQDVNIRKIIDPKLLKQYELQDN